ncbi:MAG TPA: DUF748 domain-containing protein, partial [Woeseiaceae bacterium]|nr:DUF748 domain-containing protein [Woeseiaceae bacterium]
PAPAGQAATVSNFDDIEFAAKKLSATAVMHSPWTLSATINGAGHLAASGEWARAPGGTTLRFSVILDDASILESRISAGPGLTWSGARLQSDGSFVWAADHARIDADVQLQKLEIAQINNGRPVFSVAAAEGVGIVFDTSTRPPVSVASVRLEHPRLHVERQRTGEADLPPWLRSLLFDTIRAPAWIKKVNVSAGRLVYSDRSIVPIRELASDDIVGTITQLRPGGEPRVAVSMTGRIAAAGSVELAADWLSSQPQDSTHVALKVQGIPLSAVSPFIAKALGRRFDGGDLAMNVRWSIEDDQLALENSLAIRNLQLGEVIANAPRANLELPLAAALLEDSCGVITLYMPLGWRPATPGVVPTTVIGDAIAHYVSELTSRPFETLAVLAGSPDVDLGRLTFPAGSATINDATAARLEALKLALSERPRLGLTIYPGFDPAADRKALARQQIRLHVMLATSSSPPAMAGEGAIDFNDSKVWTVLDEFSQQRLSDAQRAVIDGRPNKDATHYRAVFDALVANEVVAATALNRLARYRAQTIVNEFATSGYGNERIREADDIEATASGVATGVVRLDVWPLDDSESATEHGSPGSLTFAPRLTTLQ